MAFILLSKKRRVKGMADWPTSVWGRTGIGAMRRIFTTKRRAARRKTIRRARARDRPSLDLAPRSNGQSNETKPSILAGGAPRNPGWRGG